MGMFGCDYLEVRGTVFQEFVCTRTRKSIDKSVANSICMTGRHTECVDYKNANGCFISKAICLITRKPDTCEELMAMRHFRDDWLRQQPGGEEIIEDYYRIAPGIVEKIDKLPNSQDVFREIYEKYILPCVEHIKQDDFVGGNEIYIEMTKNLKMQYA